MFSCFSDDKKNRKMHFKDLEQSNSNKENTNEDLKNINMDNLKKMDEAALNKLKIKLNIEYRSLLYDNQINNDKIILYKTLIEEYKKNVNSDEKDENHINELNKYINVRNTIIDKEILDMKNKNNDLHKKYLALFDQLSSIKFKTRK